MIDLSNNNGVGHNFARAYRSGQRRLYLKASEGVDFVDRTVTENAVAAHKAGFKVGYYHFAHCDHAPAEEAHHFLSCLPHTQRWAARGGELAPCLDLEHLTGSPKKGRWAVEWIKIVETELNMRCLIYSYGSYLVACQFKQAPTPLWLASYGRNDGKEHPYLIPKPWKVAAAHQFASTALVPGIRGHADLSHVYFPQAIDRHPARASS